MDTTYPVQNIGRAAAEITTETWLDRNAIAMWLEPFRQQRAETYRSYKRIASYWLYYLEQVHGHHEDLLRRVTPFDAHDFLALLSQEDASPQAGTPSDTPEKTTPATVNAHGLDRQPMAKPNHAGVRLNPFAKPKAPRSVAQTISALSSLYTFNSRKRHAGEAALLDFNPFADLGRFVTKQNHKTDRLFEVREYQLLLDAAEYLYVKAKDEAGQSRALRLRWITVAFFNIWLRVSELAGLKMSDIKLIGGVWYANIKGKGNKIRSVELTSEVMMALGDYRESLGLVRLPQRNETTPAVVRTRGVENATMSARWLHKEVKLLAGVAAIRLKASPDFDDSEENRNSLHRLQSLSPHWHRHSGASETLNEGFPLQDASERLGHHDPGLTSRMYYHGDAKRRLAALEEITKNRQNT